MKALFVLALLMGASAVFADDTCYVNGNVIRCTSQPTKSWVDIMKANNAATSPEAAARAALIRQQAENERLRAELLRLQLEAAKQKANQ